MNEPRTVAQHLEYMGWVLHLPADASPLDDPFLSWPIIGPSSSPAVLSGVTVEKLEALFAQTILPAPEAIRMLLSRLGVRIPRTTIRAQVKMVECEKCDGGGEIQLDYSLGTSADKGDGPFVDCPACEGTGTMPVLTVKESCPLPAKDGTWVTLAVLEEGP